MTPALDPIVAWPYVVLAAVGVVALTAWAYQRRLRGTSGRWRWFAIGLRMFAIILCLLAALRPSLLLQTKSKQASTLAFLSDSSRSMTIADEAGAKSRWRASRYALMEGVAAAKTLGPMLIPKTFRFDTAVTDDKLDDASDPKGSETALGTALEEVLKRQAGGRLLAIVVLSDGSSNAGRPALVSARRLKTQGVPVIAVPFGKETAGEGSKDIAVRSMVAGPTVYVKNELNVSGMISARGFPGQELEVELYAGDRLTPVDTLKLHVPEKGTELPVNGLKWTPQKTGETKVRLKVVKKDGELVTANNEFSTYVTVLGGGLNVLYLAGPYGGWEQRFLNRSLDKSQRIQVTFKGLRSPAGPEMDADFDKGAYDVYILGDLPSEFLSPVQQARLARRVEDGAGLLMLGGRSSFGAGNWERTEVGKLLPTQMSPADGQIEPPDGLKVVPLTQGLDSYVLKLSSSPAESKLIWENLGVIPGANRLGRPKPNTMQWAKSPQGDLIMAGLEAGKSRVMAFGGETWPWARAESSRLAHIRFWRQAILWLAHKEDEGDEQVRLTLDRRRVSVGGRVELNVQARSAKGEPVPNVRYEAAVTREAPDAKPEKVDVFGQGDDGRGTHPVTGKAGDYKVTVTAFDSGGKALGSDSARFIAYEDDRELENPAADPGLLKQVAEVTGGKTLPPEGLAKYLKAMDKNVESEYVTQKEVRVWDNWWYLLAFAAALTLEWFLRKRHGWV